MHLAERPGNPIRLFWRISIATFHALIRIGLGLIALSATPAWAGESFDSAPTCRSGPLQVGSPDWRDQVIYFAMIDRFDNGNPRNDDQGAGEFDPQDGRRYSGGDLAGLTRRIDYIRDLGATALWITPPVANQWWDARHQFSGYHGYWAENFMRVDAHYGRLADYQRLSRCLHANRMFLVQDIVVNHVGNFLRYDGPIDPADPSRNFAINADARPHHAPTQAPFSLNDARRKKDREAAIYHWTPDIVDYANDEQLTHWQLAGLDDLNTDNPRVRDALRQSYEYWIRTVGVDAYRVDTAFYVPPGFFDDFLHNADRKAPGILDIARQTGHADFLVFGEGFAVDPPYHDESARRIDRYLRDATGKPRLPGMLNFPLYGSTLDVFARGKPTGIMAHRIRNMMQVHANPHLMPSFVDNHDVDRFLASGGEAGLRQALLLILTLPGIPVITYGTEQGFTEQRASMFAGGFGSGGHDRFDREAPLYRYLQRAIALRRTHPLLSRGMPSVLAANVASAGALAYRYGSGDETLLILFNSSDHPALLDDLDTGLADGTTLEPIFSIDGSAIPATVGGHGKLTMRLSSRSGQVLAVGRHSALSVATTATITIDTLPADTITGELGVTGTAHAVDHVDLIVDGDLGSPHPAEVGANGIWRASIDTSDFVDPAIEHRVVAWSQATATVSDARTFRVQRAWNTRIDVDDPAGDDHGPTGTYRYPTDPMWANSRPLDLRGVRVSSSGGSLRIELRMRELVAAWNPPNGFDHLATTIYLQLPGRTDGVRVMPLQNALLPDPMRWQVRLRANGWSNILTGPQSASTSREGETLRPSPDIAVDRERNILRFTFPASALGHPPTLSGTRLYVTTWDYDGGYRPLSPTAGGFQFGGGDGQRDPLVMDASAIITVP